MVSGLSTGQAVMIEHVGVIPLGVGPVSVPRWSRP
jgi:hypothetical protein